MKKNEKAISGEVRRIPLKDIVPSSNNPRKTFNADELNELAESIKENGLLQPITVRPIKTEEDGSEFAKFEIVCGERRYRATLLTGSEEIDCIVKELDDKQALTAMIFENMQRKDVDPMEEANAIDRLVNEFSVDVTQVAKMLGKSETFVRSRLRLNGTIEYFQKRNDNMLVSISFPATLGDKAPTANKGKFKDYGWEGQLYESVLSGPHTLKVIRCDITDVDVVISFIIHPSVITVCPV